MRYKNQILVVTSFIAIVALAQCRKDDNKPNEKDPALIAEGKNTFRFDTFGDEDFWSGLLHLDKAIAGSANGGFGPGVAPTTALAVGLKVDAEALPQSVVTGISNGSINLNDPATTIALLKLNAVLGVTQQEISSRWELLALCVIQQLIIHSHQALGNAWMDGQIEI